jgi:SanA protein
MLKRVKKIVALPFKAGIRILMVVAFAGLLFLWAPRFVLLLYAAPRTFTLEDAHPQPVAIVFGAGLYRDGSAGPVLRDRVETAAQLYKAGIVDKLLMSGDNRFLEYNEPEAMRQYALDLGVPDDAIVLDYAGRRTYDTCYRAYEIFQVESAILVTQHFHMSRALFLCNQFGIDATGVEADNRYFLKRARLYWNVREIFAITQAIWDVYVAKPLPVLGEPEPILIQGD